MPRAAPLIPDRMALLCEGCGYLLTGLPSGSRCPECGLPVEASAPEQRHPPAWERPAAGPALGRFWSTTSEVLFHPSRFFRSLPPCGEARASARFARWHVAMVAVLLGWAAFLQVDWMLDLSGWLGSGRGGMMASAGPLPRMLLGVLLAVAATGILLWSVVRLAARLTAWEAAYRGLRLPLPVVRRALDYHAAHYLPVAVAGFLTVSGFHALRALELISDVQGPVYLYVLCAEVLLSAGYLFQTYWLAMRRLMFANASSPCA